MDQSIANERSGSRRAFRRFGAAGVVALLAGALAAPASAHAQGEGLFVAEYADAVFSRRGSTLHVAPGMVSDEGAVTEVLETQVTKETCGGGYLITTELSGVEEAPDLEGVEVDARAGTATVDGTFTLSGTVTITPAGRWCEDPIESAAVTADLTAEVALYSSWQNLKGSVPIVYSGPDCGGDGTCYYRDASARASWSSDFLGGQSARSESGFFFEGTYSVGSAAAAQLPQVLTDASTRS